MTELDYIDSTVNIIKKYVPDYQLKQKSNSPSMKAVGWLFKKIGNPLFMEQFWTTIGSVTYRPTTTDTQARTKEFAVIIHEGLHSMQAKKYSATLWGLSYLFPQCLAGILPILFLALGHWIVAIICLGFLLPLPSPWRAVFEYEAYKVSICASYWIDDSFDDAHYMNNIVEWLSGPEYYYCWPFKSILTKAFQKHITSLRNDSIEMTEYLTECKRLCIKYRTEGV